jgi:hypothetical protein
MIRALGIVIVGCCLAIIAAMMIGPITGLIERGRR